ncbi:MAG: AEC family transporter [Clostridia bacterium]|nr:AEC family transporter [Clostridia bacterium]
MAEFLSNVYTSFTQVVILFLVAAVGFICHKTGIYTEKASRLTTNLLFYIVAPAIIIRSFYGMDYSKDSIKGLLMALLGGILFHVVGMVFATVLFNKKGQETASIFKYACCYGNVGYMALPLAQAILGDEGVFYCSVILVPFNVLSFTHGVGIMQKKEEKSKINIKKLIVNPGVIGVAIGLPIFLLQVELPQIIYSPVSYIADLNTPLAMVMFGTYLASADWKTLFSDKRIFGSAIVKLILVPLITIGCLKLFGYGGTLIAACALSASAPTASNTVMFAAKYDRDTAVASKVTAFVSVLSILTMPVMIAIAQMLG